MDRRPALQQKRCRLLLVIKGDPRDRGGHKRRSSAGDQDNEQILRREAVGQGKQCSGAGFPCLIRLRVTRLNDARLLELAAMPVFDDDQPAFQAVGKDVLHCSRHRHARLAESHEHNSPKRGESVVPIGQAQGIAVSGEEAQDGSLRVDRPKGVLVNVAQDLSKIGSVIRVLSLFRGAVMHSNIAAVPGSCHKLCYR
jgi:hypothetical protein